MNSLLIPSMALVLAIAGLDPSTKRPASSVVDQQAREAAIAQIGTRNIGNGHDNPKSLAQETKLGRQAAAEIERSVVISLDPEMNAYVDRVAQNIAKNSDSKFPITIKVVESGSFGAFALPGGFIYVNTAVIRALDNEAELAFVIAQLVGNVVGHSQNDSRTHLMQISNVAVQPATGVVARTLIPQGGPMPIPMTMFQSSQGATKVADFLGLEYLYRSGYDPQAAVGFLKKLEAMEASRPKEQSFFDLVPPATERIRLTKKNIEKVLPYRADNLINTPEFDAVKSHIVEVPLQSPSLLTPVRR